jgi:DNA-directed RNA polymerase subunit beta'
MEARTLMLASNNILSPANGDPIIVHTRTSCWACSTPRESIDARGEGMAFADLGEVSRAYESGKVELHASVMVRIHEQMFDRDGNRYDKTTRYWRHGGSCLVRFCPGPDLRANR